MRLALAIFTVVLLGVAPRPATAHGLQAVYVEIIESEPGRASVRMRTSVPDATLDLAAEPGCTLERQGDAGSAPDRVWLLDCPGGLAGRALAVRGLGPAAGSAVVWMSRADGTTASRVVLAGAPRIELGRAGSAWSVAARYAELGVAHIATGADHLLFLALLVLLLRRARAVLLAETAFTLSHSLSFAGTMLGWIRVSSVAAEACIAWSLVLLAADACSPARGGEAAGEATPVRQVSAARGAWMALAFGLVHGLGFAGGLREIGLPEGAVGPAIVSFAAGVELGQVAFLTLVLGALHVASRSRTLAELGRRAGPRVAQAAGLLSAYWLFERAALCFR